MNRYIVRWVSLPGRHVVVIDTETHEIVWDHGANGTQDEAYAEADRLNGGASEINRPTERDLNAAWGV